MDDDVDGNSIDWFLRQKLQENPMIFMGKSGWFPVSRWTSLFCQPIEVENCMSLKTMDLGT